MLLPKEHSAVRMHLFIGIQVQFFTPAHTEYTPPPFKASTRIKITKEIELLNLLTSLSSKLSMRHKKRLPLYKDLT